MNCGCIKKCFNYEEEFTIGNLVFYPFNNSRLLNKSER